VWSIESPAETATTSTRLLPRKPPRRNCVKLTQFLPLPQIQAPASRLQSGTTLANPMLFARKSSCGAWRSWSRWCPVRKRRSCPVSSKSVMPICTVLPGQIFRIASRLCTKFCTRKTVPLRSRATHTTLESTTPRWKSLSGGFSRTLIF